MILFPSTTPWPQVQQAIDAGEQVVRCRPGDRNLIIWDRDLQRLGRLRRELKLPGRIHNRYIPGPSYLIIWNTAAKQRVRDACKKRSCDTGGRVCG
jgi:hypothetical protein